MAYSKQEWKSGDLISAQRMNKMETGIDEAHKEVTAALDLVKGNKETIEANAAAAEKATQDAIKSITTNTEKINQMAKEAEEHLSAATDVIAKVDANVDAIAANAAAAKMAKDAADANKLSIDAVKTQLENLTAEGGPVDTKVAAAMTGYLEVERYNEDQQNRTAANDAKYAAKADIEEAINTATEAKGKASDVETALNELKATHEASEKALEDAKALIEGNAAKIEANAAAAETATASIEKNAADISKMAEDAAAHIASAKEAVDKIDANVTKIAENSDNITALTGRVDALEQAQPDGYNELKASVEANTQQVAENKEAIAANTATANAAKSAVEGIQADFTTLQATVNANTTAVGEAKSSALDAKASAQAADLAAGAAQTEATGAKEAAEAASKSAAAVDEKLVAFQNEMNKLHSSSTLPGDLKMVLARIATLEARIDQINKSDVKVFDTATLSSTTDSAIIGSATVADEDGKKTITATDIDVVLSGNTPITMNTIVTAKTIDVKNSLVNNGRLSLTALGAVSINGLDTQGDLPKTVSNSAVSINTNDYVRITDSTLGEKSYNGIEIGLSKTAPAGVVIDGLEVVETSNNAINVFAMADNGVITVSNSAFGRTSNIMRLSNRNNGRMTINMINCDFGTTEEARPVYGGIFCFEDYTSKTAEECVAANQFAPNKVTINLINCTWKGQPLTAPEDMSTVIATGDANQIAYIINDAEKLVAYDPARYPTINIR